jgi:hypothetical protein
MPLIITDKTQSSQALLTGNDAEYDFDSAKYSAATVPTTTGNDAEYNFDSIEYSAAPGNAAPGNAAPGNADHKHYWDSQWRSLNDNFPLLAERLGITPTTKGGKCRCPNPDHDDSRPSAQINQYSIKCHGCGQVWGAQKLINLVNPTLTTAKDCLDFGLDLIGKSRNKQFLEKTPETQAGQGVESGAGSLVYIYNSAKLHPTSVGADGVEFDRAYRELAPELTEPHRKFLRDKYKLSDAQIDSGFFASIARGQKIGSLPTPKSSGILCPVWQGNKIVGAQIRTTSKEAKYIWLGENGESRIQVGNTQEIPLTILPGAGKNAPTFLIEGTLKAWIFWLKAGKSATIVGAAGGNWASDQLAQYIQENNPRTLRILADADTLHNNAVYARTLSQMAKIEALGFKRCQIVDYGQILGNQPDPDEWIENHQDKLNWHKDLRFFGLEKFKALKGKLSQNQQYSEEFFPRWIEKCCNLNGQIFIDVPDGHWFSDEVPMPEQGDFVLLSPPTGTGKTHFIKRVKKYFDEQQTGIILITPTENAGRQAAKELGIHYYQDHKDSYYLDYPDVSVCLCAASLHHLESWHFQNRVVVFDELSCSIRQLKDFKELLKSTREMSGDARYKIIFDNFKSAMRESLLCIGLDAFFANIHLDWVKKQSQKQIKIYSVAPQIRGKIYTTSDKNLFLSKYHELSSAESTISYSSDSRLSTQQFADDYAKKFPENEVCVVNSRTLQDDASLKDFVAQPTFELENRGAKLFSYSPSMLTGGDVQNKFDYQFAEMLGVVDADLLCQQPRRCRNVADRYYYIPEKSDIPSQDLALPNEIIAQWNFRVEGQNILVDSADLEFFADLEWCRRFASKNLKKCVTALLLRDGYELEEIASEKTDDDPDYTCDFSDGKKRITQSEYNQLASVKMLEEKEYDQLRQKDKNTSIESDKIRKFQLGKKLQGIDENLLFNPEFLYWLDQMRGALITRWLVENFENSEVQEWQNSYYGSKKVAPQMSRNYWMEAQILAKLKAFDLPENFTSQSKEVVTLCDKIRRSKDVQLGLRIKPLKENIKLLRLILAKTGHALTKAKTIKGKRFYSVVDAGESHVKNPSDWASDWHPPLNSFSEVSSGYMAAVWPAIEHDQKKQMEEWQKQKLEAEIVAPADDSITLEVPASDELITREFIQDTSEMVARANGDIECLGYVWAAIKSLGNRAIEFFADRFGHILQEIDPVGYRQYAF